jgi:hypothetical protein
MARRQLVGMCLLRDVSIVRETFTHLALYGLTPVDVCPALRLPELSVYPVVYPIARGWILPAALG